MHPVVVIYRTTKIINGKANTTSNTNSGAQRIDYSSIYASTSDCWQSTGPPHLGKTVLDYELVYSLMV